jgi:hypothetical protein
MINFMQTNQDIVKNIAPDSGSEYNEFNIIDNDIWDELLKKLLEKEPIDVIKSFVHSISIKYNIDKKNIIKDFLNYIIRNYPKYLSSDLFKFIENLMHSQIQNNNIHIFYSLSRLSSFIQI